MTLVVAALMALAVVTPAWAASITINRDDSWDSSATEKKATYTYYKIFDADITSAADVDASSGELSGTGNVVYTISGTNAAQKVNALPDIFTAKLASDGKYYITLTNSSTGSAAIVSALKTLVANNGTLFPGTSVTSDASPVTLDVGSDGYYLIEASNGKDAAVQTIGNVEINEKNDYPTVSKEQKKAADSSYTEAKIPAEVGTYVDFKVTVHIPTDATKAIAVVDKMSSGLQYDDTTGLTLSPGVSYTTLASGEAGYDAGANWQIKLSDTVVQNNRGSDIVITYRALVTADALTDTDRENEVTLNYDNSNYILKDSTEYTTYFGGIEKVDGQNASTKLDGVKFNLTVGGANFKVSKPNGADYYVPDASGSSEVETDSDGKIVIRGLDSTKTYTLTETKTKAGYNLLDTPKDLTLTEDTGDAYTTATFDQVVNNKGIQLPSTGGMGTTILCAVGGLMVVAGGVWLVTKQRLAKSEK